MIEQILGFQARVNPHAPAVLTGQGAFSFADMDAEVDRTAAALEAEPAFASARRVGVSIADTVRHWVVLLALLRLGRLSISLPLLGQANGAAAVAAARPDLVLRDAPAAADEAAGAAPGLVLDDAWRAIRLAPGARPASAHAPGPEEVVRVLLSSGTTGLPKAVPMTLARMDAGIAVQMNMANSGRRTVMFMGPQTIGGTTAPFATWARGGAMIFTEPGFGWPAVLATLEPDCIVIAPADISTLLRSLPPEFTPQGPIQVLTGGSGLPQSVCADARRRLGARINLRYGSTEAGPIADLFVTDAPRPVGATGYVHPLGVEVEVVDEAGRPSPPGRSGELRVRGPLVVLRYEGGDEAGAFRDGWLHPGDIGRLTPEGLVVIEGRTSEVINLGGAKYAPLAIEEVVRACPGVGDAAAFAAPSATGEITAYLALVAGDDFRFETADAAVRSNFPKLRLHLMRLPAIPRNAMGKAEHQTLRRMVAARQAS